MRRSAALLITVLVVPSVVFRVADATEPPPVVFVGLLVVGSLAAALLYTVLADGLRSIRTLARR